MNQQQPLSLNFKHTPLFLNELQEILHNYGNNLPISIGLHLAWTLTSMQNKNL